MEITGQDNSFVTDFENASVDLADVVDDVIEPLPYKLISADSHVIEPPGCYVDNIDPKYRDIAPHSIKSENGGDVYVVDGLPTKIPMGGLSSAGVLDRSGPSDSKTYDELPRGGFDGKARAEIQDRDGIAGEIIYPSVGMVICNHPDPDYKKACFDAYNLWLQEFQSAAPDRIFGVGQTAVRSVKEAVEDIRRIKEMGFHGVMMPGEPATEFDYDDPAFDELWEAAIDLELPLSFHILTSRQDGANVDRNSKGNYRGKSKANFHHTLIRANQDIIALLIWGGVFKRFPELKIVCVEADAGWAPHFMYRMDHWYNRYQRFRYDSPEEDIGQQPSRYFRENIYLTFQDDFIAFQNINLMNEERLLWANDFPHGDSLWPWSRQVLGRMTKGLTEHQKRRVLRDNVKELYNLHTA